MKKLLWLLLKLVDNNWGYTTPIQERFKAGDKCKIHFCCENNGFSPGETVTIIETGRHDYLVENESGLKQCVFQFELYRQIQRKSITPKTGKRKPGFMNQAWAALVKERDKKCTNCGSVYDLHAHHIKPYKSHPELRLDVNNGTTLCGSCHRDWHKKNGK